ncbi:MAG: VWA domain-containing protein [Erythrobacter sp.]
MRQSIHRSILLSSGAVIAAILAATPAAAQDAGGAQADEEDVIIATGVRIRQGGAQDVKHFRSISLDSDADDLPRASSFTLEGLMGEHDLLLPANAACEQLFCINAQSMAANLPAEPDSTVFVGLGFESGVDAETYRAGPVSIIATVDRSGSMTGEPLMRVKESLRAVLGQMREGDRIGIVVYGSKTNVHMPVMDVEGNRDTILAAIDSIAINGSTYMEAGMKLGYKTAMAERERSNGQTRMMLFSDENANVGDTSANGFMAQASRGAMNGVGLTSIGVGRIFDGRLASKISAVQGGNLFFVGSDGDADALFEKEFFNMVSEVARDIKITIDPADGYRVADVYGVPDNILERSRDGSVTATIGSAFLSSNGGGIFASLAGAGSAISPANISISYVDARDGKRFEDVAQVASVDASPPANLRKAQMLVDQYSTITSALDAFHNKGDALAAQASLADLNERMAASGLEGMGEELKLVSGLSENAGKLATVYRDPAQAKLRQVLGEWKVLSHRGLDDISRGDFVRITKYGEFITERGGNGPNSGDEFEQEYEINKRQILIKDYDARDFAMDYTVNGNRMRLRNPIEGTMILLERDDS